MGQAKRQMEENEANGNLIEFLEELLKQDSLTGALEGIAKQVVDKGIESMTARQNEVIESFVEKFKKDHECDRCSNGNVTSLLDLIFIEENGLCPMCEYDKEKYMRN